jgi:hypothetical protein
VQLQLQVKHRYRDSFRCGHRYRYIYRCTVTAKGASTVTDTDTGTGADTGTGTDSGAVAGTCTRKGTGSDAVKGSGTPAETGTSIRRMLNKLSIPQDTDKTSRNFIKGSVQRVLTGNECHHPIVLVWMSRWSSLRIYVISNLEVSVIKYNE